MDIIYIPLIFGFFLNMISTIKIKKYAELRLRAPYEPLPDLVHDYFPRIPILIPDYCLHFCIISAIIHYKFLIEIKKNILCIGICMIIRSFSMFLTIFPTCMPKPNKRESFYTKIFLSTHDLMFSGHSILFIGVGQMLDNRFIQIFGPLLVVLARQHYTIDVCVSGLVYSCVYSNFKYS